jgi:hypothetical protein
MADHFVAFWNVENLFAPEGFAGREPWLAQRLAKDLQGWTQALFDTKIAQLASIVVQMNAGGGPDVLGVCEVENAYVLQQLTAALNGRLPSRTYAVAHADSTRDQRGIDTAFVYDSRRYTVDPATVFSHWVMRRTGTRDITQATFRTTATHELIALCNHWPSRSGGAYESRGYRMTAGETLGYFHERIWETKGNTAAVLAMGDFNDDPFDASLQIHARATRERGDVERARTAASFYNLAWRYLRQDVQDRQGNPKLLHGTLYYDGDANVFDQLLASKGLLSGAGPLRVKETSARIEAFPAMVDHRVSEGPIRFGLPKGDAAKNVNQSGFSDHFPVSVVIEE